MATSSIFPKKSAYIPHPVLTLTWSLKTQKPQCFGLAEYLPILPGPRSFLLDLSHGLRPFSAPPTSALALSSTPTTAAYTLRP